MDKIINALTELHKINSAYSLPNEAIDSLLQESETAKVCMPIIGKFSSGKSALLNTILGYSRKMLRENITPETAVPTEIVYCNAEEVFDTVFNDGTCQKKSIEDYQSYEPDATAVKCVQLKLRNHFLAEIPDVMLVDMPGFDSGFEVHNRAIDSYLPQSLAYMIAFPADDMILRSSVGNLLKELCLHDMPICVVITKYERRNDDFESTFTALQESLKRFVGEREITYCRTSNFSGDAEEVETFLKKIQEQSQQILANKFRNAVLASADATQSYLTTALKSSALSESELDEQEEMLRKKSDALDSKLSKEKGSFDLQISECVEEIKADVQTALECEESTFVTMAMNGQSINEKMNVVIRSAVTVSVKKRLVPKVEKYLKRVANCINGESIGDIQIAFNFNAEDMSKGTVFTAVAAAAAAVWIGGPVMGVIVGGIIALVNKWQGDKKREETKQKIRMQLQSEVYPQVQREVGKEIEIAITKQIQLINTSIEEDIVAQRTVLEKAMSDVRQQMTDEKEHKEKLALAMNADLERISVMRHEL
ncbi:MAG: dynamin family protein [Ruthenibacterium sp.]